MTVLRSATKQTVPHTSALRTAAMRPLGLDVDRRIHMRCDIEIDGEPVAGVITNGTVAGLAHIRFSTGLASFAGKVPALFGLNMRDGRRMKSWLRRQPACGSTTPREKHRELRRTLKHLLAAVI